MTRPAGGIIYPRNDYSTGGGGSSTRLTPAILQLAAMRNDGTISLPTAPVAGNTMLWVFAGWSGSESAYAPTGFTRVSGYDSDGSNRTSIWKRTVQVGDTGSYTLSGSDNQGCVLYEVENYGLAWGLQGGFMNAFFTGTSFSFVPPESPFDGTQIRIISFEQDFDGSFTITAAPGLTVDYRAIDGGNHRGAIMRIPDSFSAAITGSTANGPQNPVYGVWTILGKKV